MYFDADYGFLFDGDEPVEVTVTYLDAGPPSFLLEYDSNDPATKGLQQRFRAGPVQKIKGSGTWREVTWTLPHARFAGRANGCDFRFSCVHGDLAVAGVKVRKLALQEDRQ
jgi:hypothetical protein